MTRRLLLCLLAFFCSISFFMSVLNAPCLYAEEKIGFLFLTITNTQKQMFLPLVMEEEKTFNVKVISLQELKKTNKKDEVRDALRQIWHDFPFVFCGFYDKIVKGDVSYIVDGITYTVNANDPYYWNLDGDIDYKPEFSCSRITDSFLKTSWENSPLLSVVVGMSFFSYPYTSYCSDPNCALETKDLSIFGENVYQSCLKANIKTITLYETRSVIKPKYSPDISLTKENFLPTYSNSAICILGGTAEPHNAFKNWEPSYYEDFMTSIWSDTDKNGLVDKYHAEIETEEIWDGKTTDNRKRLIITDSPLVSNQYALINFGFGTIAYNPNYFMLVVDSIINHVPFGQSICSIAYNSIKDDPKYLGSGIAVRILDDVSFFGLPNVTIDDLAEQARIQMIPDIQNGIEIPISTSEYSFTIQNVGKIDVPFYFVENQYLNIDPSRGVISVGSQQEIRISIKKVLPKIGDLVICSTLKMKKTLIFFRSNVDYIITVKWYSV